jgi:hypothetical protein
MLLYLIAAHAVCDYPLQGDFLSRQKNRLVPGASWRLALAYHAIIHGVAVQLITGSWLLCGAEILIHAGTDYSKGRKWISFNQDQAIHVACKLLWWILATWVFV